MYLQLAKGVKDIPPEEKILKNKIVGTLAEVFELYGFSPLETPILERYETLSAKFAAGEASDALKETFKLQDQGGRELGLRFDLTVPLARFIAMNPILKMPFKRYEMGQVFRDGPIKAGRVRQFWQCDIDTIGSTSMLAEAEILQAVARAFEKLGLDVVIKVNNRKLLSGMLAQVGMVDEEKALIALDKLDKIGKKGVTEELLQRGFAAPQIAAFFELIGNDLAGLKKKVQNAQALQGIAELEEVFSLLRGINIQFEVSLARGLVYYTGTVYEVFLKNGTFASSLAGGGRWDDMIGKFMGGNREIPAVGIAFGLEPIMEVLKSGAGKKSVAQVYIIPINTVEQSLKIAEQLRQAGVKTDFCLGKKGVSKNLEYASALRIPYVVIIGDEELKLGKVVLRDMGSGIEQVLTMNEVVKLLTQNR